MDDSINKKNFSLNVLTLAGGTAFAQGIGLVVIPILTRLYSPADYGAYAQYAAFFNLLVPLVHFRYAQAIMLPKEEQEALEVLRLSLKLSIVFGVVLFTFFLFSDFSFYQLPGITDNFWVLGLISLALIFGGMIQTYNEWSNRMKNYFIMSFSRVTQMSGMVITQCMAGLFWGSTLLGLIAGHILGNLFGLGTLILGNKTLKDKSLLFTPYAPQLNSLRRYKRFPLYTSWGCTLDGIASYGTPLLFAIFFQPDMVGKYALANTALSAPVMLIGHSISKVLYQRMSEYLKNGLDIKDLVGPVLFRQFLMSLVIATVIYFFGPALFGFFFGDQWVSAGQFAKILIPAMFFQFMLSGVTSVLLVKERQDLLLIAQTILALTTAASILLAGIAGLDENMSLTVFSITRALANLIYITIICKVARVF